MKTIAAGAARDRLPAILDDAEKGKATVILRHSRPAAVVISPDELEPYNLFRRVMTEVGETLAISRDPGIIEAVKKAQDEINRGEVIWDEETSD